MARKVDEGVRRLHEEVAARQFHGRAPQPIAEVLSRLLARKGYAQVESASEREEAWNRIVGPALSDDTRVGNLRRGILEVTVRNSAVAQELSFQKGRIVKELAAALPELKIRDLRFRVGAVE